MGKFLGQFQRVVIICLLALMMITVGIATIELVVVLCKELLKPPIFLLDVKEMLEVFGFFMMVLIGLELIESIRAYLRTDHIHAEVVILVALVAVARKIIILDYKETEPELLFGIAVLVISLGLAFYFVRKAFGSYKKPE